MSDLEETRSILSPQLAKEGTASAWESLSLLQKRNLVEFPRSLARKEDPTTLMPVSALRTLREWAPTWFHITEPKAAGEIGQRFIQEYAGEKVRQQLKIGADAKLTESEQASLNKSIAGFTTFLTECMDFNTSTESATPQFSSGLVSQDVGVSLPEAATLSFGTDASISRGSSLNSSPQEVSQPVVSAVGHSVNWDE